MVGNLINEVLEVIITSAQLTNEVHTCQPRLNCKYPSNNQQVKLLLEQSFSAKLTLEALS